MYTYNCTIISVTSWLQYRERIHGSAELPKILIIFYTWSQLSFMCGTTGEQYIYIQMKHQRFKIELRNVMCLRIGGGVTLGTV